MARKNLLTDLIVEGAKDAPETKSISRISGNPEPLPQRMDYSRRGAVGAMSRSLEQIGAELAAAKNAGAAQGDIVDLQPTDIDGSFVADRIGMNEGGLSALADAMKAHGQQVPVLVRPHPDQPGRYQAVYGHRRIAAAKRLGVPVKAIVRVLSDEAMVVAQGQENSARADLSFIERASFAHRLETRGFSRDTIMAALSVDKTELSRMISTRAVLSEDLVIAIGPAPAAGRRRWMELAEALKGTGMRKAAKFVATPEFASLDSDARLVRLLAELAGKRASDAGKAVLTARALEPIVTIESAKGRSRLIFDEKAGPGFAAFVGERIGRLWEEFTAGKAPER